MFNDLIMMGIKTGRIENRKGNILIDGSIGARRPGIRSLAYTYSLKCIEVIDRLSGLHD